eukprot:TRINITY_DN646_c0_g1_i1.p2 TRINITY_DN646_c0_g1~~TRINITY_DN646_c0_g1_i1.p2  ORF type:complete len:100 (+),score=14.43 TRINITY_DN646_c0_g1_i1:584-883(+)
MRYEVASIHSAILFLARLIPYQYQRKFAQIECCQQRRPLPSSTESHTLQGRWCLSVQCNGCPFHSVEFVKLQEKLVKLFIVTVIFEVMQGLAVEASKSL